MEVQALQFELDRPLFEWFRICSLEMFTELDTL